MLLSDDTVLALSSAVSKDSVLTKAPVHENNTTTETVTKTLDSISEEVNEQDMQPAAAV